MLRGVVEVPHVSVAPPPPPPPPLLSVRVDGRRVTQAAQATAF